MASFIRQSNYRHVHADVWAQKWEDIRLASKVSECSGLKANERYVAIPWGTGGGGNIALLDWKKVGSRTPPNIPVISGHQGGVLDFEFNPFDDGLLASASEDGFFRLFRIPEEGLKTNLKENIVEIQHAKKVSLLAHNPAVANVVTTGSYDHTIRTFNVETQSEVSCVQFTDLLQYVRWNAEGALLAVVAKDKFLHVVDPRTGKVAACSKAHEGVKSMKCVWLDGQNHQAHRVLTTGFSAQAERQLAIWDIRNFTSAAETPSEPLYKDNIDQGIGPLFPTYDPDCRMLYLAGKGDGNVKYFECVEDAPFLHYISDYRSTTPQKGFDFLPKLAVNVGKHEIMRGIKCESTAVVPISFLVPRKSECFQEDIFPDTYAPQPALCADEWESEGKPVVRPTVSMAPGVRVSVAKKGLHVKGIKEYKDEAAAAQKRIKELEKENAELRKRLGGV